VVHVLLLALVVNLVAGQSLWPWAHRGDVRAVVQVPPALRGSPVTVEVVWRRHDVNPELKRVVVTDSNDVEMEGAWAAVLTAHSGIIAFTPPRPMAGMSGNQTSTYFVYWLPYTQSGIGRIKFAWDTAGDANWTDVGTWNITTATSTPQLATLKTPIVGTQFRWRSDHTAKNYQPFLRELRFRNGTTWLSNHATAAKPSPVADSSGWQPNGVGCGQPW
jgi:hypothetical protein